MIHEILSLKTQVRFSHQIWPLFFDEGDKVKWLKHYSNAYLSNSLTEILAQYGPQGYGRYWLLLEKMCEKFDGETDDVFVFNAATLKVHLGFHKDQDLIKFLSTLNQVGIMSHTSRDQVIEIKSDILLRLQGRDWNYDKEKRVENAAKKKNKIKIKNKKKERSETGVSPRVVVDLFNSTCQSKLAKVEKLSDKRKRSINTMSHSLMLNISCWEKYFGQILTSDFLIGINDRGWRADFDWLINQNNAIKVLEGKYEKRSALDSW